MDQDKTLRKVYGEIEALKEEMVDALQRLVRTPSVVGQETAAQRFMEQQYRGLGLDAISLSPDLAKARRHPAFIESGLSYENRANLIGRLPGEPDSRSLILNGHIDVVSPEPIHSWTRDPWGAVIEGERMYGRGAGDMKSGLLANFFALKAILKAGLKPRGTVMLWSVIDEEVGGAGGTLACLLAGYTAPGMICTEPHNLNITIAHAGISFFTVKVMGRTAHGGQAHLGVNAIGKMYPIYQALIDLDERRGREVVFPLFVKGSGRSSHINIGTLRAGDWPSMVAGSAEMGGRIGFVPGETLTEIRKLITSVVNEAASRDPWLREHPPVIEWPGWQDEPWYQNPEHPFVRTFRAAAEEALGHDVEFIGRASGLDTRFSRHFGIAAACTGPRAGSIHGPDEYVEIPSVIEAVRVLSTMILRWCGCRE